MTSKLFAMGVAAAVAIGVAATGPVTAGLAFAEPPPAPAPVEPAPPAPAPAPAQGAPLPTPDEVSGMLTRLTNAGVGYKEKGDLVENGIQQVDGHALDSDLRKAYRDGELPYTFNVLNVVPTTPGNALATVTISGPKMAPQTTPLQLVDQGGSWVLSQQSAKGLLQMLSGHGPAPDQPGAVPGQP